MQYRLKNDVICGDRCDVVRFQVFHLKCQKRFSSSLTLLPNSVSGHTGCFTFHKVILDVVQKAISHLAHVQ